MIIDGHCHVGVGHEYQQSVRELLDKMDALGVDRAVICPVDRCIAVDNREGNDFVINAAKAHSQRLYAFATANPWYGKRAVQELQRAMGEGARGIKLHPALQGFLLCDELVYPLVELAEEFNVPMFFHTGTPAFALPTQLVELAQRFPRVNFIMGHMGSTDFKGEAPLAAASVENVYLDTSWILPHWTRQAIANVGPDRVLFSSDSPLSTLAIEIESKRAANLSPTEFDKLMALNMLRLLGEQS